VTLDALAPGRAIRTTHARAGLAEALQR
jgi:hypothetical protein